MSEFDTFFKENVKKPSGGQARDPQSHNFKFNENEARFYRIRDYILNKKYRIKIIMILALKGISWRKELQNTFDLHPQHITEVIEYLKEEGLVFHKPFIEIDLLLFETVISLYSESFYNTRDTVKVYVLSDSGKEIVNNLKDDILTIIEDRPELKIDILYILDKTDLHRKIMNRIKDKENKTLSRCLCLPNGLEIEVDTKRYKDHLKAVKDFHLEYKEVKRLNNG